MALVVIHLWSSAHVSDPTIVFDENGYLGNARWLAGGSTWEMPFAPAYSSAYSLAARAGDGDRQRSVGPVDRGPSRQRRPAGVGVPAAVPRTSSRARRATQAGAGGRVRQLTHPRDVLGRALGDRREPGLAPRPGHRPVDLVDARSGSTLAGPSPRRPCDGTALRDPPTLHARCSADRAAPCMDPPQRPGSTHGCACERCWPRVRSVGQRAARCCRSVGTMARDRTARR